MMTMREGDDEGLLRLNVMLFCFVTILSMIDIVLAASMVHP